MTQQQSFFDSFFPLVQNLVWGWAWHFIILCLYSPLTWEVSSALLCLLWHGHFGIISFTTQTVFFLHVLHSRFVWCSFMIIFRFGILGPISRWKLVVPIRLSFVRLILTPWSRCCLISPLVLISNQWEDTLTPSKYLAPHQKYHLKLASTDDSSLNQLYCEDCNTFFNS